ncbi:MAG: hypothetical protein Q4B71_04400 [Cardiobacteriaceae bacterium]|nr:hypothetical protein [Cardiobacteriaceae bacterium]
MSFLSSLSERFANKPKSNSAQEATNRLTQMTLQVRGEIDYNTRKSIEDAVYQILVGRGYRIERNDVHMEIKRQHDNATIDVAVNVNNLNSQGTP